MFDENYEEDGLNANFNFQLEAFEQMYANDEYQYLDSDDLEYIVDHLLVSNQFKKAEWAVRKALDHFPQNSELIIRLAQILTIRGESNNALKLLLQLEQIESNNSDVALGIALCYKHMKNSGLSIRYFKRALELASSDDKEDIIIDLAVELERDEKYQEAIELLIYHIENGYNTESLIYELGHCYEKLDDYESAAKCFLDYIDENPYSLMTWYNLGNTYYKFDMVKEAIWAYEYTIIIDEDFIPAYYSLANAYFQDKRIQDALECYKKCLEVDDKDPLVFCSIGECLEEEGEFEKAYDYYCLSTELMPQLSDAWLGRGIVSDILGNHTRAIQEISVAIKYDADNSDNWKALGNAYENDLQEEKAYEAYLKAIELSPEDEDILIDYMSCLMKLTDKSFFDVIKDDKYILNTAISKIVICYAHWEYGNRKEAISLFNDIVEESIELTRKLFYYFPEMGKDPYFLDLFNEIEEENK